MGEHRLWMVLTGFSAFVTTHQLPLTTFGEVDVK